MEKRHKGYTKKYRHFFVTIGAGWLSGYTSPTKHSPNNSMTSYPVLSDIDRSILENAYIDYQTFKQSMS
jgi:hypothetical protein